MDKCRLLLTMNDEFFVRVLTEKPSLENLLNASLALGLEDRAVLPPMSASLRRQIRCRICRGTIPDLRHELPNRAIREMVNAHHVRDRLRMTNTRERGGMIALVDRDALHRPHGHLAKRGL